MSIEATNLIVESIANATNQVNIDTSDENIIPVPTQVTHRISDLSPLDSTIFEYIVHRLPFRNPERFYRPYDIAVFLSRFSRCIILNTKVTKCQVVNLLIRQRVVPFKQTALYKLVIRFNDGELSRDTTWTELEKHGHKPYLSQKRLMLLVERIREESDGGLLAYSASDIRNEVKREIIKQWTKNGKLHQLPSISENTINIYVSMIKAQDVFNIHGSIGNKTKSRAVAEWSIRSTISFLMTVGVSHFLPDINPTVYHPKKKNLSEESALLWNLVESYYNKMIGDESNSTKLLPVLPNLVTSTDKITIFATSSIVNGKESFYVVARPQPNTVTKPDSGSRNNYKKEMSGDQHCRGIRIVINSTFTAGGLSSPIFVSVYGLTADEMPGDEIITIPVPGLTVGSHQDVYSTGTGYVTFVRGSDEHENTDHENDNDNIFTVPIPTESKESRVAQIYREKVYHPFIQHIRKTKYGWDGNTDNILDHLQAVSWMDGANAQIKKITSNESLKIEEKMKVTICKHLASRTAVEQAADCGPMFKLMKRIVKEMDVPHAGYDSIFKYLEEQIDSLMHQTSTNQNQILILSAHKKQAILATIPKLPIATGHAFTIDNVKKGFIINGQLDSDSKLVPSFHNIIQTYCGDTSATCLENHQWLFEKFYEQAYVNGIVQENIYDINNVPIDRNYKGVPFCRDMNIALENRQRAKVLSSPVQIEACNAVVAKKKLIHYQKQKAVFDKEANTYMMNEKCEIKLLELVNMANGIRSDNVTAINSSEEELLYNSFSQVKGKINIELFNLKDAPKIINKEIIAFVKVRSVCHLRGTKLTYKDILNRRDKLLIRLVELRNTTVRPPMFTQPPIEPEEYAQPCNVNGEVENDVGDEMDKSGETDNGGDINA